MIKGTDDFQLVFTFKPNKFFEPLEIKKRYFMGPHDRPLKTECTKIQWKSGMKPNFKQDESFFEYFMSRSTDDKCDHGEMDIEEDYDFACEIRDELFNLALEYYLNIMETEHGEEED